MPTTRCPCLPPKALLAASRVLVDLKAQVFGDLSLEERVAEAIRCLMLWQSGETWDPSGAHTRLSYALVELLKACEMEQETLDEQTTDADYFRVTPLSSTSPTPT